ncbi:predicted protein [Sclerotinia sclerotiorum 1980 UF-70]|uniref:Uncharacterized protein n=1 Tax=Sclerotinia sclerotiorum (strain ATCC 18683 / 1980 / Ss-1) TaxID=665079 RepID=A7E742_SCLS1|nr:predicted protein [Sclerotinia sclerotiorum 1980 UF-70]EDN96194.1 predicted protein [Sclerotinia sclerotiorum 1980 UF-70]
MISSMEGINLASYLCSRATAAWNGSKKVPEFRPFVAYSLHQVADLLYYK